MFNGFPLVFFIRDTLHIGPASNVFSAFFFAFALLLMLPTHLFLRIYKPNSTLLKYAIGFIALIMYHFFAFNTSGTDWFIEFGNIFFTVGFIFLLLHIPNEVKDTLIHVLFVFSLFSNLTLVYSLMTDPNWKIGMRAAVTFENENAQAGGNPHIAARNALICLLTSILLFSYYKNILIRLGLFSTILFSLGVVVLAQVKSSMLAIGLMIGFFLLFNSSLTSVVRFIKNLITIRSLIVILVMYFGINFLMNRYSELYGLVYGYWHNGVDRILDVLFTAFGVKFSDTANIDASAMGRVSSFNYFSLTLKSPEILLFGRGYKSLFMDVPLLESLINHGIFGLIFFGGFNYYLFKSTIKELKEKSNILTQFLAYFFIYFIVLLVSNGRPYDVSFWFPYAVMIRFLGVKYLNNFQSSQRNDELQLTYP
jgi:hypothetical protein